MICLHHNDLDGRCSAAIVQRHYKQVDCIEMDYAKEVPFDLIADNEDVIIVDFSLQNPGDWEKVIKKAGMVTWIDHHETAIKNAPPEATRLPGYRDESRCAAYHTWMFYVGVLVPEGYMPEVIKLIDLWDRWAHNDQDDVLDFVYGMKVYDQNPHAWVWNRLLNISNKPDEVLDRREIIESISRQGEIIREFESVENNDHIQQYSHIVNWEGYHCLALNSPHYGSKVFDDVDGFDMFIIYIYDGLKYTVHLYSPPGGMIKVNKIADKYGGGGHPGAAGFVCDELPWR